MSKRAQSPAQVETGFTNTFLLRLGLQVQSIIMNYVKDSVARVVAEQMEISGSRGHATEEL
jgi:hypothetical protein